MQTRPPRTQALHGVSLSHLIFLRLHSVHVRFPFSDCDIARYAASVGDSLTSSKCCVCVLKWICREFSCERGNLLLSPIKPGERASCEPACASTRDESLTSTPSYFLAHLGTKTSSAENSKRTNAGTERKVGNRKSELSEKREKKIIII